MKIGWPLVWTLVAMLALLLEGVAIGQHQPGDTLSETVRAYLRFDPIGKTIFLPLWCWLSFHWVLRRQSNQSIGWPDFVAIAIGFAWALIENHAVTVPFHV